MSKTSFAIKSFNFNSFYGKIVIIVRIIIMIIMRRMMVMIIIEENINVFQVKLM